MPQYLTEEGSDSELLLHSDEHCYFCLSLVLVSVVCQRVACALAGRLAAMPAFQTPSTLCHVYFVAVTLKLNGCHAPTEWMLTQEPLL